MVRGKGQKEERQEATETEMVRSCERGIPARVYVGSLLLLIHFHCVTVRGGKRTSVWLECFKGLYTFLYIYIIFIIINRICFFKFYFSSASPVLLVDSRAQCERVGCAQPQGKGTDIYAFLSFCPHLSVCWVLRKTGKSIFCLALCPLSNTVQVQEHRQGFSHSLEEDVTSHLEPLQTKFQRWQFIFYRNFSRAQTHFSLYLGIV